MALSDLKVLNALNYTSGALDRDGDIVDMAGWDGIICIVKFGAITGTAETTIKWQQGAAATMSDAADIAGSLMTVADNDDNQIFVTDLERPTERYVRIYLDKATEASAESAVYVLYGPNGGNQQPISSDATNAVTSEHHFIPAEGDA